MFNNKKDVLLESVKKIMQESELHRKLEAELNEAYGIASRAALPHEYVAEYDAILAEAKKMGSLPRNAKEAQLAALAPPRTHVTHKDVLRGRGVIEEDEHLDEASLEARQKVLARSKMRSRTEREKLGPDASSLMGTKEGEAASQASAREAGAERGVMRRMKPSFGKNVVKEEKATEAQKAKIAKVMHKWKQGKEHIGKSEKTVPVTKEGQKQAVAIALSQAGLSKKKRMDESLESIHEEIRNTLWEKLDYVYENYGEEAAMEVYASLTEEERFILEYDGPPDPEPQPITIGRQSRPQSPILSQSKPGDAGADFPEPPKPALGNNIAGSPRGEYDKTATASGMGDDPSIARDAQRRAETSALQRDQGIEAGAGGPGPARTAPPARSGGPAPAQPRPGGAPPPGTRPAPTARPARPAPSSGGRPAWAQKAFNPDTGA